MKQEEQPGQRYVDPECRMKFATKLMYPVKSSGFQSLRMDDVARYMDISKATLYKYFSSKEEIVSIIVEIFLDQIVDLYQEYLEDPNISFGEKFQRTFTQTMMIANYGTEPFLSDLREAMPEQHEKVEAAIRARNEKLQAFYEAGMEAGAFERQNAALLVLQDELLFRKLIDPIFLTKRNLTLRGALFDYYLMKKKQLLTAETAASVDDEAMNAKMDMLVNKILHGMA
ncbi:TetR/AcrR family transcriptional regulator [Cohnella zeiphila]|uniref:TetR/AcrR family transcriptional regulator n=1 Tax=Cohnella zeiphila TaxID=2761120 RepID=A0A7X0VYT3_9BACL|nr:TetR/AcrR family transcriptional regulator [Cohnella zeiphila]MBB6735055.1 TetR/AcrR family transcriptional regulator [Cohnella zeiphila]